MPACWRSTSGGRPAKWYRRTPGEISYSVPERRYALAATLLARAVERAADGRTGMAEALREVARAYGRDIGRGLTAAGGRRSLRRRRYRGALTGRPAGGPGPPDRPALDLADLPALTQA
ncbi:MAG: hypothetical protein ACRDYY_15330 [Acidimicrobiales bacterium]